MSARSDKTENASAPRNPPPRPASAAFLPSRFGMKKLTPQPSNPPSSTQPTRKPSFATPIADEQVEQRLPERAGHEPGRDRAPRITTASGTRPDANSGLPRYLFCPASSARHSPTARSAVQKPIASTIHSENCPPSRTLHGSRGAPHTVAGRDELDLLLAASAESVAFRTSSPSLFRRRSVSGSAVTPGGKALRLHVPLCPGRTRGARATGTFMRPARRRFEFGRREHFELRLRVELVDEHLRPVVGGLLLRIVPVNSSRSPPCSTVIL